MLRLVVNNARQLRTEAESRIAPRDRDRLERLCAPPPKQTLLVKNEAREARRFFFVLLMLFAVCAIAWVVDVFGGW